MNSPKAITSPEWFSGSPEKLIIASCDASYFSYLASQAWASGDSAEEFSWLGKYREFYGTSWKICSVLRISNQVVAILSDGETVVVAESGTDGIGDWPSNLMFRRVRTDWANGKVARGYAKQSEISVVPISCVLDSIFESFPGIKRIVFTGHSKGGAAAACTSSRIVASPGIDKILVMISPPKPGNSEFAKFAESECSKAYTIGRAVNGKVDGVMRFPLTSGGASHVGSHGGEIGVVSDRGMLWGKGVYDEYRELDKVRWWNYPIKLVSALRGVRAHDLVDTRNLVWKSMMAKQGNTNTQGDRNVN